MASFFTLRNTKPRNEINEAKIVEELFCQDQQLIVEWESNFIALLVLYGNALRTSVYEYLMHPSLSELSDYQKHLDTTQTPDSFLVQTSKSPSTGYGPLILHPKAFCFIDFYVRLVLPYIYYRHSIQEVDNRRNCLLLQASNGYRLKSIQVKRLLNNFISQIDVHSQATLPTLFTLSTVDAVRNLLVFLMRYAGKIPPIFLQKIAMHTALSEQMIRKVYDYIARQECIEETFWTRSTMGYYLLGWEFPVSTIQEIFSALLDTDQ